MMKKGESKRLQCNCEYDCWTVHLMGGKPHILKLSCIQCGTVLKFKTASKDRGV